MFNIYYPRFKFYLLLSLLDYIYLQEALPEEDFPGHSISVDKVPAADSLQVYNIRGIKERVLTAYFQDSKKSGGCRAADVTVSKDHNCAIVTFENYKSKWHSTCIEFSGLSMLCKQIPYKSMLRPVNS